MSFKIDENVINEFESVSHENIVMHRETGSEGVTPLSDVVEVHKEVSAI